jgi:ferredoxin-nitrite reductase
MTTDFTAEQKHYLEGFMSGLNLARNGAQGAGAATPPEAAGPEAIHVQAQNATTARGGKLNEQEKWKRNLPHPFDAYDKLKDQAAANEAPKPPDNFRWRYHGLFYVAPAQNSYMCRLRMPNGILKHWQLDGLADAADNFGGGYSHVTTRANLQIREIEPRNAVNLLEAIQDLGLTARGSGADNIRNVTGTPTAGIDPQELLDTRPYAREWHFHILNDRSLYGLPRKFNVAFDGAGVIPVLEDTNDIAFQAVEVRDGFGAEPGVWFRFTLGGITGHKDFARETGVVVKPADATKVADAVVRVFIEHGDRTNRNKARLKYVLDTMGMEKFVTLTEEKFGAKFTRVPPEALKPRPSFDRAGHIGVHAQKQAGLNWIGVVLPVGKLTAAQMRGLAKLARDLGDGEIRLTVWQNLLISGIPDDKAGMAKAAIAAIGLATQATPIRAGLIACTGNTGCKFAASNTKDTAQTIAEWCEPRVNLDTPINIHLTGCHHSCAQHYIGDIGLIGARVPINDEGDTVEGYHILVGGGFAEDARIGAELYQNVKAGEAPEAVAKILRAYRKNRASADETFIAFARRHDIETLRRVVNEESAA